MKPMNMKYLLCAIVLISGNSYRTFGQHTEVQLGAGFYYTNFSSVDQILFIPSYKDSVIYFSQSHNNNSDTSAKIQIPKVNWVVISNVTSFGLNKNYVIAISKNETGSSYWIIDKTKEPNEYGLTKNEERMNLSNVRIINFKKFVSFQKEFNITVHDIEFYSKNQEKN